jgi:glucose/arabinose dehydrogenase
VWVLDGVSGEASKIQYTQFASGLDEPLGLMRRGDALLVTQRSEVTELRDTNGNGLADSYLTLGKGWNVSGAYHGYAYGPAADRDGRLWATLNLDMGEKTDNAKPWRGWGVRLRGDGTVEPMCAGMRSPCGLGANLEGDLFFTDQQGNWIPTNNLHHLRPGAYYGNPDGLSPESLAGSPLKPLAAKVDGLPYPDAMAKLPQLVPPAVWFPYGKIGRSRTGFAADATGGKFGPYAGQLFVGEFTESAVDRVFLEKVGGEYQGACFPFLSGFPSAVMTTAFGDDGSMFVGMSNRGWSSLGHAAYGLCRVRPTGKVPFELLEMCARPDGFELVFTAPFDPATATDPASYRMESYTYPLHERYGGDEIDRAAVAVSRVEAIDDRRVRLVCDGLRELFVHELHYAGVRSAGGREAWHDRAYYTLNRLPED